MKLRLDSIILFARDVGKLKSFYTDILLLDIIEESGNEWILLNAGHCHIGLHKIGDQYLNKSKEAAKADSNTKMVFEVADIHQARKMMIGKKVPMKEIKTFDNYAYWLCDGEDPEGNVFQLKQKKQPVQL